MNNTTNNTDLTTMTPKEIDKLLLDLEREKANLGIEMNQTVRHATYVYSNNSNREGMVVREVREAIGRYKSEAFYVLASDYEASPCEFTPSGNEKRVHLNNGTLIDITLAYLTDKRLSPEQALEIIATQDNTSAGEDLRYILRRKAEIKDLIRAINAEFDARGGWARYWLVTSSNGHIHSSPSCHTCNKGRMATGFALVYHLSGEIESNAVEVFGPALCSVCYPDAPVEMTEQAKVSKSLATHYFDGGYEAWKEAKAKADARKAKKEAVQVG